MKMRVLRLTGASLILLFFSFPSLSQKKSDPGKVLIFKNPIPTVCYATTGDVHVFIPPPGRGTAGSRTQAADTTAQIQVTYTGFSTQAKKAFQYAVNIWKTILISKDTIHIQATWRALGDGVLGSASPASFYANFDNAQRLNVYYPIALAEKMAGHQLNDASEADIAASFNSNFSSWYYGTDGKTPSGKYDLVSVVLHEIGHGLGIFGFYSVSSTTATFSSGVPGVFDTFIETSTGKNILSSYTVPSTDDATAFKSGALYFNSPLELLKNSQQHAQLYAPATFSAGSSIYHLDETKYPAGNKNSLMTPIFNPAEAIHNPGPIVTSMLKDMGWLDLDEQHSLPNTEDISNDFPVTATISHDTTYDHSSVKLFYSTGSTTFTSVPMTEGNTDVFSAVLPKPSGGATSVKYYYYISAVDAAQRTFVFPGVIWTAGSAAKQNYFVFTGGPDTHPPIITHVPVGLVRSTDTSVKLDAVVTDDYGVQSVTVQYKINNVSKADVPMTLSNTADSTYSATINLPALNNGDSITYKIVATDVSAAHNTASNPKTGLHRINVVSLAATQDSYSNDFNSSSNDFFGDALFGISTASGFTNGAINTTHPYKASDPSDSISYVYELRIPIRINSGNPTIQFDEIALVEPNTSGSVFGGDGFFDYVVVEGSSDGGVTWKPFLTGYNSRANAAWLTKWNSSNDGTTYANSTGVGTPSLYVTRTINMTATKHFKEGDEVVIRFRLLSDQLTYGWGWAIDNLKIQIDQAPPTILHNQIDFITPTTASIGFTTEVYDASGVQNLSVEYKINNGDVNSFPFTVLGDIHQYTLTLDVTQAGLVAGDEVEYRIVATDSAGNTGTFPASGFLNIEVLDFSTSLDTYTSDFNTTNTDFAGNFFSVGTATGFTDGSINTPHPYPLGFGLDSTSSIQYMLKKPIKVSADNPLISFREVVILESTYDYVVVEGSKDGGVTWHSLTDNYTSKLNSSWTNAFSSGTAPTPSLYKGHLIDITGTGDFTAGDNVLIRFRLYTNETRNGFGWTIDDLSIQGTVTGLENNALSLSVYPNPVTTSSFTVEVPSTVRTGVISLMNIQGQQIFSTPLNVSSEGKQNITSGELTDGLYFVKILSNEGTVTKKLVFRRN